jgi:acetoin utilization protein AcuB
MKLYEIMTPTPVIIDPGRSVGEALLLMASNGIRHLPILEQGRIIGIVSDRDLRAYVGSAEVPVRWIMTRAPLLGRLHDDARQAAQLMATRRIGSLPIIDDSGRVVGIVTTVDLMNALARPDGAPGSSV